MLLKCELPAAGGAGAGVTYGFLAVPIAYEREVGRACGWIWMGGWMCVCVCASIVPFAKQVRLGDCDCVCTSTIVFFDLISTCLLSSSFSFTSASHNPQLRARLGLKYD